MGRIISLILAFYLTAFAAVDTAWYNGRYRLAVWNQANYQVYRVYSEVRSVLNRIGIGTIAVARP